LILLGSGWGEDSSFSVPMKIGINPDEGRCLRKPIKGEQAQSADYGSPKG